MRKNIFLIFITGILIFLWTKPVKAKAVSDSSAQLSVKVIPEKKNEFSQFFLRKEITIRNVLRRYQSPLVEETKIFILTCKKYQLDCYLLPAISGVESTFGKFVFPGSYNPFGWGGGYAMFKNWQEAIEKVGKNLKETYVEKWKLMTIEQIGEIYAENPLWASKVKWFIDEFKKEEERFLLYLEEFPVEF
ncbi:MAG: hypothetical protein NZL96_03095 [Patescibacteria group bacterium]|nr:hypothetical protein [Patescibacteria group bacterium]